MLRLAALSLCLAAPVASAAPRVVMPQWKLVNVKPELGEFFGQAMASQLRARGLEVSTAQDMATLLGMEKQRALLGCDGDGSECLTELSNALGADATLTVNLARFESGTFRGIATLLDGKTGVSLVTASLDAKSEEALLAAIDGAAKAMAKQLLAEKPGPKVAAAPQLWWVPGVIGLASAAAGGGLFVGAGLEYEKLQGRDARAEAEAVARGKACQTAGWVAVGVGAGLVVTSAVLLAVLPKAAVTPSVSVSPAGASVGVQGHF